MIATGLTLLLAVRPVVAQQTRIRAEWTDIALQYRDQPERRLTFVCPPGGEPSKVYGTDVYTADSSICSAATHAGVIDAEKGGPVTIVVGKGSGSYEGSTRNGVTSEKYGDYPASFSFERENVPGTLDWATTGAGLSSLEKPLTIMCPPEGDIRRVWGTEIYTEDSSICSAAVHAGHITAKSGGAVTVEAAGPQDAYKGSEQNGVTSAEWRSWPTSFRVSVSSGESAPAPPAPSRPIQKPSATQTISTPALSVSGVIVPLVAAQNLSTPQLSVAGIFVPLLRSHSITTATLTAQGQ